MLVRKLLQTRRTDAELPPEIRAALVDSLFAPIASLIVGAIACTIIGAAVAIRAEDGTIMATSLAILVVGMVRVASAVLYKRGKRIQDLEATRLWERVYELGAWAFSALLGALCFLTLDHTDDATLHLAVSTTAAGYAAAISGRNAARPIIAVGQLTLTTLPLAVALLIYPDWVHKALGIVVLMFIYGMVDITLSIRDIIIQALTVTRKEAALAARFEEQANRFDVALNNMSHGLCMLDQQDRLQVWNERFLELLRLEGREVREGMSIRELVRSSVRAGNHAGKGVRAVLRDLTRGLQQDSFGQVFISLDGERTIALSRRVMTDGGSVVILEDITERRRAQERITRLARFDELTGLANRAQFRERLEAMLAAARRSETQIAIHLIDLDRFKSVNDTLGHPIGDKLLQAVALRLGEVVRRSDLIARFGGDEFVVVQADTHRRRDAGWLALRIVRALEDPFEIDGHRIDIGASIGVALAPRDGTDADQLLKKADMALYAAKNAGGGGHRFFAAAMESDAQQRRALELDLRQAVAGEAFELHFQPLVNLATGRITTCEALLRWHHPTRGAVPPSVFIPIAEETGLIIGIGEWALRRACEEAARWPDGVKVAVNLSPVQFRDRNLAAHVVSALARSGLPAHRLELEITERVLLEESEATTHAIQQFRTLGVSLSLDDFGTGYSSLNYLRKFPFAKIKIDQSFIRDVDCEAEGRAIIRAVAGLGTSLGITVVAEGLETKQQMAFVREDGCHEGQGYLFGRPMPAAEVAERIRGAIARPLLVA